jgi:hypothetical protein
MKKLSLLILVIAFATGAFAQNNMLGITTVKKITTDEVVTSLKVYKNVEVILTSNELNVIQVIGEKTDVENTAVKISNGELTITGSDDLISEKVVVYVPSKFLDKVYIHGSSNVSSAGILNNEVLDVTINGIGKSNIQSNGMINLNTIGDFPLETSSM